MITSLCNVWQNTCARFALLKYITLAPTSAQDRPSSKLPATSNVQPIHGSQGRPLRARQGSHARRRPWQQPVAHQAALENRRPTRSCYKCKGEGQGAREELQAARVLAASRSRDCRDGGAGSDDHAAEHRYQHGVREQEAGLDHPIRMQARGPDQPIASSSRTTSSSPARSLVPARPGHGR